MNNSSVARLIAWAKSIMKLTAPQQPPCNAPSPRPTAQDDAWVARLIAWADEFQIPKKDLPRKRDALLTLQTLDLSRLFIRLPEITRLPPEIGQLQQLQTLWLKRNQLTALPVEITHLRWLEYLSIEENPNLQLISAHEQFLKRVKEVKR